jgi:hypothetical protein
MFSRASAGASADAAAIGAALISGDVATRIRPGVLGVAGRVERGDGADHSAPASRWCLYGVLAGVGRSADLFVAASFPA